jgi:GAF domain-containing protein
MDETGRHLRLLTETIAAVNSTLDLEEVLSLVASNVADALDADACFVYLYESARTSSCCARRTPSEVRRPANSRVLRSRRPPMPPAASAAIHRASAAPTQPSPRS